MQEPYLEITFRHGRVLAAYYYLPRVENQRSARSARLEGGIVVDYDVNGAAIGIEVTAPRQLKIDGFNRVCSPPSVSRPSTGATWSH
ncbi:MAG: DUF2283 domain-containing protein [Pirellulales bacterium]|nr:DUF2283 domain-containing protein [Pirellulales bacterium]